LELQSQSTIGIDLLLVIWFFQGRKSFNYPKEGVNAIGIVNILPYIFTPPSFNFYHLSLQIIEKDRSLAEVRENKNTF
jgi:hypothetical protein